ncbi:MAG: transglutaminase domain-containing protein [Planctomycetota bacterium]|nr:MAG: transglutaminase domain-containing protein [Planctomycetota bacterium]
MLVMEGGQIPQLSVMHVESLQRSASDTPQLAKSSSNARVDTEDVDTKDIDALAREWTTGVDDGWQKVETICQRLRREFVLDAEHMAPADVDDVAAYFLFESKRGPDYLFATSAALLIRSLGYETRVVSGFYADPEHYDRQSRLTPIYVDDAHFWVEVLAQAPGSESSKTRGFHWLPVEPSPGYQVLLAPESLWSQWVSRAAVTWHALKRNPIPVLACLAVCMAAWVKRAAVGDFLVTRWWEVHHRWGDARYRVIATLRLLDRRARVRGFPRPKGSPVERWQLTAAAREADDDTWSGPFRDLANWALYGEDAPLEFTPHQVSSLCRDAVAGAFRPPRKRSVPTSRRFERTNA